MGWWSSILGSDTAANPVEKLDPQLREFLKKESPASYTPTQPPTPSPSQQEQQRQQARQRAQSNHADTTSADDQKDDGKAATVPAASLYPDGRYAHLWKNYRPLAQIEAESATEHDRMADLMGVFKSRSAAVGNAALENCALQQEEWVNCMRGGAWEDRLQMCRHQRFLRALGYVSVVNRPASVDDDIQMHADALFQRMLAHETAVEQAKKDGTPIPTFELQLHPPSSSHANAVAKSSPPAPEPSPELIRQWEQELVKLSPTERAVEEAALRADLATKAGVAASVNDTFKARRDEREARMARGQGSIVDVVTAFFTNGDK